MHTPEETAAEHAALTAEHGRRFLVGIGVSHAPVHRPRQGARHVPEAAGADGGVPRRPRRRRPAAAPPTTGCSPRSARRCSSSPATRTAGTHPYLVTPEHTAIAREALGPDAARRHRAGRRAGDRSRRRPGRSPACTSPRTSACRTTPTTGGGSGFTDDDLADGGSDRLVDALVVWGDEATIAARVQEHRDAGARPRLRPGAHRRPARLPARRSGGPSPRALTPVTLRLRPLPALRRADGLAARARRRATPTSSPSSRTAAATRAATCGWSRSPTRRPGRTTPSRRTGSTPASTPSS